MANATDVETKHLNVGAVSYAYRELRPTQLADPTPLVFLHRFRGTLDDWDPAFVDELARTRHVIAVQRRRRRLLYGQCGQGRR